MKMNKKGGFTLLELLIVIAILAILSVALVIVLNPAETLKKARDAQRISDLSTLKTAIGLYMTSIPSPQLDGVSGTANALCKNGAGNNTGVWASGDKIFYSIALAGSTTSKSLAADVTLDGGTTFPITGQSATVTAASVPDGTGWIPVNFSAIAGGSPISNVPVDPINTVAFTGSQIASSDLVYRYACLASPISFEIDATLESEAYTVTDNKLTSDGGNNINLYETGTNLLILGTGADF